VPRNPATANADEVMPFRILITGFGRFPGAPVNPSGLIATRLARRRRPTFDRTRRIAHVFATCYDAIDRELPVLLAQEKPDIIVMFGVATRSHRVRVEERARNRIALYPDADGRRPAASVIAPRRDALRNPLPLTRLVHAARTAGVAAARSRNAGAYLCNYAYWRALEAAARPDGPHSVIFIHVPPIGIKKVPKQRSTKRRTGARIKRQRPALLNDLVRAGEAIVLAMMSLAAAGRQQGALRSH